MFQLTIEYFFHETDPVINLDSRDVNHFALRMRRRMTEAETGKDLVKELKVFSRDIGRVKFDKIPNSKVINFNKFLAQIYPEDTDYAGFQLRGFDTVLSLFDKGDKKCIVVSAPTASGKSKVFISTSIFEALEKGTKSVIIYPRLSLMQDQLSGILKIWARLKNKNLTIGIQRSGLGSSDFITINYGAKSEDSFLEPKTNGNLQGLAIRNIKCPLCRSTIWAPTAPVGMKAKEVGKFSCQNKKCDLQSVNIFVSKEKIIKNKPSILITTIDSISALLFRQNFEDYLLSCKLIVFDEAHAYESINGAHAANLIKRLTKINENLKLILASATIPNPKEFAHKLTGIDSKEIELIEPMKTELDLSGKEQYRLLKVSDNKVGTVSLLLQLQLMLTHSVNIKTTPHREKILSFFDSRDLVNRVYFDFIDADMSRNLANFRIEKELYISSDKYRCPNGSEANCDVKFCSLKGNPYHEGECWYGLTKTYFQTNQSAKTSRIKIARIMSGYSEPISDVDLILSTSSMELGVDDKSINTIIQYKAPLSIYAFIQRKGRGGRDRNLSETNIWMVTGDESTDRFYYNNLDSMLDQQYHIPLNPENQYSVWVARVLEHSLVKLQEEISELIASGEKDDDFDLEYSAVYRVAETEFFPKQFKEKLKSLGIQSVGVITKRRKETFAKALDREIAKNIDSLKVISNSNDDIFDSIAQKCGITDNPEECNRRVEAMLLHLQRDDVDGYKKSYLILMALFSGAQFDQAHKQAANDVIRLLWSVPELFRMKQAVQRNREVVYENKALNELNVSLPYRDPYYAFLHMIRSVFYWLQGHPEDSEDVAYLGGIKYLMPLNFFSTGDTISLDVSRVDYGDTNFHDLIFRYLPHRLSYYTTPNIKSKSRLTLRYLVTDSQPNEEKGISLKVTPTRIIGHDRLYKQKKGNYTFNEPTHLSLEDIETKSDDESVKFCSYCYNVFSDDEYECVYHKKTLERGRMLSRAIFRYVLGDVVNKPGREAFGASLKYYNLYLLLDGEDLTVIPENYKKRSVKIEFEMPLGKEISQIPVIEIKIKSPADDELDYIKRILVSKGKEPFEWVDYLHSIAHFYVKLVSFISGVNTEYITYHIDPENSIIRVFELSETDTGIADSFLDSIVGDPYNFMKTIKDLSTCKSHLTDLSLARKPLGADNENISPRLIARKADLSGLGLSNSAIQSTFSKYEEWLKNPSQISYAEISETKHSDHIIACIDGCPDCVQLNNCHERYEQDSEVSRIVVERYTTSLFKEMSIEDFSRERYEERLVKQEGLIYGRRGNKIIRFEI